MHTSNNNKKYKKEDLTGLGIKSFLCCCSSHWVTHAEASFGKTHQLFFLLRAKVCTEYLKLCMLAVLFCVFFSYIRFASAGRFNFICQTNKQKNWSESEMTIDIYFLLLSTVCGAQRWNSFLHGMAWHGRAYAELHEQYANTVSVHSILFRVLASLFANRIRNQAA